MVFCNRCKREKSDHLFHPSELDKDTAKYCMKCVADRHGWNFGTGVKARKTNSRKYAVAIRLMERRDYAVSKYRKESKNAEMQRLIEQRKARLRGGEK